MARLDEPARGSWILHLDRVEDLVQQGSQPYAGLEYLGADLRTVEIQELGDYEIEPGGSVVLRGRRYDGSAIAHRLDRRLAVLAVFFDDPLGEPVQAEVLTAGESIDYGWCRAYPGPEGHSRSLAAPTGAP